jgi:hypothetical protein
MVSLYFIHDHHVLKLKLYFMWLILMKPMFAYIVLEFGSQLHNLVFVIPGFYTKAMYSSYA